MAKNPPKSQFDIFSIIKDPLKIRSNCAHYDVTVMFNPHATRAKLNLLHHDDGVCGLTTPMFIKSTGPGDGDNRIDPDILHVFVSKL